MEVPLGCIQVGELGLEENITYCQVEQLTEVGPNGVPGELVHVITVLEQEHGLELELATIQLLLAVEVLAQDKGQR